MLVAMRCSRRCPPPLVLSCYTARKQELSTHGMLNFIVWKASPQTTNPSLCCLEVQWTKRRDGQVLRASYHFLSLPVFLALCFCWRQADDPWTRLGQTLLASLEGGFQQGVSIKHVSPIVFALIIPGCFFFLVLKGLVLKQFPVSIMKSSTTR